MQYEGWGRGKTAAERTLVMLPVNDRQEQRDEQTGANRAIFEALIARDAPRARALSPYHLTAMVRAVAAFPLNA